MTYTYKEHQRNVIVGVVAGMLSGVFFAMFYMWQNKGIWTWIVPIFILVFYGVIITPITWWLLKDKRKK